MPYVTDIERMAEARGEARQRSIILRQLTRRIGVVPQNQTDRVQALSIENLELLAEDLLDFQALEDLMAWFKAIESLGILI